MDKPEKNRGARYYSCHNHVLSWINDLHGLVWQQVAINSDGTFTWTWGRWFWVHAVYSDGMSFTSVSLAAWFCGKQFKYLTFSVIFGMIAILYMS
ncbi:MAG: histidine kinase N-terminal 7TM domain-containing protein [Veillonellales bacterium]